MAIGEALLQQGLEKDLEKGRQEGRQENMYAVAKNMIQQGLGIELIQKITSLSLEQVRKLTSPDINRPQ